MRFLLYKNINSNEGYYSRSAFSSVCGLRRPSTPIYFKFFQRGRSRAAIRSALNYHDVFYLRDPGKDIEKRFRGMTFAYTFRTNRLASVSIYPFETSRNYACVVCCFAVKADYGVKGPEQDDKWEVGKKVTCHLLVSLKMDRAAE